MKQPGKTTRFRPGQAVHMPTGNEVMIQSFDGYDEHGQEVYTVISARVHTTPDGRPYNVFKAKVIPTLMLTGVAWEQFLPAKS